MEQHTLLQREESPRSPAAPSLRRLGGSRHITHWDPEDLGAWEAGNKGIARRNLLWSVVTVHLGYSVWTLWPVLELLMPQDVYGFSTSDKFLLGTIATLFGAFLRMPYALASAIFGGRNWATFSAIVLLIPAIGTTVLLTHPGLPLWPYLVVCGPDRLRRRQLRVVNEQRQCFLSTSAQGFGARNCRWGRQSRGAGDPASWVVGNRHCR